MKTIGYKLTALSPTRGASAELAASLTVVTASYIGLPVSTTNAVMYEAVCFSVLARLLLTFNH
jgi:phosphate/sulfate permease